jgi:hypothetical protein
MKERPASEDRSWMWRRLRSASLRSGFASLQPALGRKQEWYVGRENRASFIRKTVCPADSGCLTSVYERNGPVAVEFSFALRGEFMKLSALVPFSTAAPVYNN